MRVRNFLQISGTCVAVSLAAAHAQQDTTRSQPGTLPGDIASNPDDVGRLLEKRRGVWQVEVMLSNTFWSKMHGGAAIDQRYITTPGEDRNDPTRDTTRDLDRDRDQNRDPNRDATGDNDRDPADRDGTGRIQPSTPNQAEASQVGMTQLTGYAEADLVLGDKILRERIVIPNGTGHPALDRNDPNTRNDPNSRNDPSTRADPKSPVDPANRVPPVDPAERTRPGELSGLPHAGAESFSGISYIEFNPSTHTYDMVFLGSMSEGIHYDTGIFDAQRNRIVFRGNSGNSGWQNPASRDRGLGNDPARRDGLSDPSRTNPSDPADRSPISQPESWKPTHEGAADRNPTNSQPESWKPTHEGTGVGRGMGNFVVVLEMVDDNTHTVTMYDTASTGGLTDEMGDNATGNRDDSRDNRTGDRDDRRNNGAGDRDNPGQPGDIATGSPNRTADEFGRVVYRATYTRAPESMRARITSIIDSSIEMASR